MIKSGPSATAPTTAPRSATPPRLPRPIARSRAGWFALLALVGVVQAAAALGSAAVVERGFTLLLEGGSPGGGAGAVLVAAVAAVALVAAAGRWAELVVAERVGQSYVVEVRDQLFSHLTAVPARRLGEKSRGNMLLKFVGDISALRSWVSLGLSRLLVAGVAVVTSVIVVAVLDPGLGVALGAVLALGAGATGLLSRPLLRATREARRRRAKLTGEVTERLSHVGVVQAGGQERRERRRVARRSAAVADAMLVRARTVGLMRGVAEATTVVALGAVLVVGALRVSQGAVTASSVVAVMTITGFLAGYLRDLGRVAEYAAGASVARRAALGFLAIPPLRDVDGAVELVAEAGGLVLEGVGVGTSLVDVTAQAPPGSTVAVIGPNGAGKSTLVSVVARLTPADTGRVVLDGQDLARCSLVSVRRAVGVATPDLPLLRGTLSRNVRYRLPRAPDAAVERVADLTGLDVVVESLADGWSTEVGDGGARLSAGQRARAAVARAALGDPLVLVLDEAEAHLDGAAVAAVEKVVDDRSGRLTTLVVTHRRELVERADLVWFLRDGRLVEQGSPAELLGPGSESATARLFGGTRPSAPVGASAAR